MQAITSTTNLQTSTPHAVSNSFEPLLTLLERIDVLFSVLQDRLDKADITHEEEQCFILTTMGLELTQQAKALTAKLQGRTRQAIQ